MTTNASDSNKQLTHFNEQGRARMVDISEKRETKRSATAICSIQMNELTLERIKNGKMAKGDVLAVAQVAGVIAAKKTSEWIPMCHPISITGVDIMFSDDDKSELYIEVAVKTNGQTGVEMEALTAATASALTVYDMCKAIDKGMVLGPTMLLSKSGGKSGDYYRNSHTAVIP